MTFINTFIPFASAIISFIFSFFIFKRYAEKRRPHLLLWGLGMVFYGIGGFCEAYFGALGWNDIIFRMWYLFGAILVAAFRVFGAQLDPTLVTTSVHTGSELSGHAIVTPGIRTLTPFFNIYGVVTLVGGAVYSAWIFYRKRVLLHRTIGNILIAVGALAPAFGGAFSRFGIPGALYIGELLGATLIFLGFLRATTPMEEKQTQTPVSEAAS
jgi:hypothetical protein